MSRKWREEFQRQEDIKAAVRARDGYRCFECGLDQQTHVDQTGKGLEVHRLFPGSDYQVEICIALCKSCHGRKPKTVDQLWFHHNADTSGVLFVGWEVVINPANRAMYATLKEIAHTRNISIETLINEIVSRYIQQIPQDYSI